MGGRIGVDRFSEGGRCQSIPHLGGHIALLVSEESKQALERIGASGTQFKEV